MTAALAFAAAALVIAAFLAMRGARRGVPRGAHGPPPQEGEGDTARVDPADPRARPIQALTASLLRATSPAQVAEATCRAGAAITGAQAALLVLVPEGGQAVELLAATCSEPAEAEALLAGPAGGAMAEVLRDGRTRTFAAGGAEWVLHAVVFRDRPLGVLGLRHGAHDAPKAEAYLESVLQQCAQALERTRLYVAERSARVRAEFAERRLAFLSSASARLGESLDLERSLADVADLVVTEIADLCVILVRDPAARVETAVASRIRDGRPVRIADIASEYPVDPMSRLGWPGVLRSGRGELIAEMDEAVFRELASGPRSADALKRLDIASQVAVPVRAGTAVIGAITIAASEAARPLTQADLQLAEELAVRVGQAIDRYSLFRSAIEASRAKSDFLAVVSHELKTPLNAILGFSDLMLAGMPVPLPEEARHQAERVNGAARQLLRLLEDVLAYARADGSPDRLEISAFPLDEVVSEAAGLAAPLAAEKSIDMHCSARTGAVIQSDAGRVRQILNNLVSNAVKFTERGRVDIQAESDGETVVVRVRDTGIGIAPEHLARIFDPFWQVEPSTVRRFGGAGIGLGVVRRLSRQLGGDVAVASEPGRGSTFELRLPLRLEPRATGDAAP